MEFHQFLLDYLLSYEYNQPIQIIFTLNKDILLNEKSWSANKNAVLFVYYSKLIDPYHFKRTGKTREEYYEFVQHYPKQKKHSDTTICSVSPNMERDLRIIQSNTLKGKSSMFMRDLEDFILE
jgi:hypothetical protein